MQVFKFSSIGTFKIKPLEKGSHKLFRGFKNLSLDLDMGYCVYHKHLYKRNSYLWFTKSVKKNKFYFTLQNEYKSAIMYMNTNRIIKNIKPIYTNYSIVGFEIFFNCEKVILLELCKDAKTYSEGISYMGMYYKNGILEEVINTNE